VLCVCLQEQYLEEGLDWEVMEVDSNSVLVDTLYQVRGVVKAMWKLQQRWSLVCEIEVGLHGQNCLDAKIVCGESGLYQVGVVCNVCVAYMVMCVLP